MFGKKIKTIHLKDFNDTNMVIKLIVSIHGNNPNLDNFQSRYVSRKKKGETLVLSTKQCATTSKELFLNVKDVDKIIIEKSNVSIGYINDLDCEDFAIEIKDASNVNFTETVIVQNLSLSVFSSKCVFEKEMAVENFYPNIQSASFVSFSDKGLIVNTELEMSESVMTTSKDFYFESLDVLDLNKFSTLSANVLFDLDLSFSSHEGCDVKIKGEPKLKLRNETDEPDEDVFKQFQQESHFISQFVKKEGFFYITDDTYILGQCILDFEYPYYLQEAYGKYKEHQKMLKDPEKYHKEKAENIINNKKELLIDLLQKDYPTEHINSFNRTDVKEALETLLTDAELESSIDLTDSNKVKIQKMCFVLDIDYKEKKSLVVF